MMTVTSAVALLAVALVGLAACAPHGGYYEDPQVQAARINSSAALIGLGTSLMFAPRYQPGLVYPTHQRCYRMGPEVHCDGW